MKFQNSITEVKLSCFIHISKATRTLISTCLKIINALVRSRLTYSYQSRALTKRQADHVNAVYVSMLRKMIKGGYRWKSGTFPHEFSNAENNHQFIAWQQQNFITHMIRGENSRRTKRLLFDDAGRETNTL